MLRLSVCLIVYRGKEHVKYAASEWGIRNMKITYDPRFVPAHDMINHGQVLLMNEAPGPDEAASRIPLYGQQGANLFHALRDAGIKWAVDHEKFTWPRNDAIHHESRQHQKKSFLATRSKFITCTNSYSYWPKPTNGAHNFCPPLKEDVFANANIERIQMEIKHSHSVLLICGVYSYLACIGNDLTHITDRVFEELTEDEIEIANTRLNSHFKKGWYMGHTRRWSLNKQKSTNSLRALAKFLNWPLLEQI